MANLLGVHCSVSGGLEKSFDEARKLGINTFQIFTRNQRQWKAKPIDTEEKNRFLTAFRESEVKLVFSHASYLINLASDDPAIRSKSIDALKAEVERCTELNLSYTVLHPGAAKGQDEDTALSKVATALKEVIDQTSGSEVKILLENTAGQGSALGWNFQHLRTIMDRVEHPRIAMCFDTCHAFAAGYDIRTAQGISDTLMQLDKIVGLDYLKVFHLNDSKGKLGSRIDRHENIGLGELGAIPFREIMRQFPEIPKVIETPKEDDWDEKNLEVLRSLVDEA